MMKKYNVVYADPPWKISFLPVKKETGMRFNQYKTMKTKDICRLDVNSFSADDSVLFLWSTNTFLPDALKVMGSWGFKYHCCITWDKVYGISMRGFNRITEFLLFGYKGKFPDIWCGTPIKTLFKSKREGHSVKPDCVYDIIENKFPKTKMIELFSRNKREGWDVWGDEVESDIEVKLREVSDDKG